MVVKMVENELSIFDVKLCLLYNKWFYNTMKILLKDGAYDFDKLSSKESKSFFLELCKDSLNRKDVNKFLLK